jgi:cell division protein FtsL
MADTSISALERAKLDIESQKLELEHQKLDVERYKARWSAGAVGLPLVALVVTAATGVWNQHKQSQLAFSLKAAEIIMATDNPGVTKNKAIALSTLFPGQLPRDFAKSFDENSFGTLEVDVKREVVNLLVAKPESASEILRVWKAAYPDDKWIEPIEAAVASGKRVPNSKK